VFRWKEYRFYFFSREERRAHVHISCADGEAKFWVEPAVLLVENHGLSAVQLREIEKVVREKKDDILNAWREHFEG
jgi:hypothetical protein